MDRQKVRNIVIAIIVTTLIGSCISPTSKRNSEVEQTPEMAIEQPTASPAPYTANIKSVNSNQQPYVIFVGADEKGESKAEVWKGEQLSYDDAISKCLAEATEDSTKVQVFNAVGEDRCEVVDLTSEENSGILEKVNQERVAQ